MGWGFQRADRQRRGEGKGFESSFSSSVPSCLQPFSISFSSFISYRRYPAVFCSAGPSTRARSPRLAGILFAVSLDWCSFTALISECRSRGRKEGGPWCALARRRVSGSFLLSLSHAGGRFRPPAPYLFKMGRRGPSTGDPGLKSICGECCVNDDRPCDQDVCLSCCLDDDGCDVVDDPPTTAITGTHIKVNAIVGNVKLQFERKGGTKGGLPSITVKLKQIFDTGDGKRIVTMKTRLTGADASLGGLLFPIAFLGLGTNALDAVRAQGLDVSFVDTRRTDLSGRAAGADVHDAGQPPLGLDRLRPGRRRWGRAHCVLTKAAAIGFPPCQIIL